MKNFTELNNRINLRSLMINAETIRSERVYGKNSATAKSKNFKSNIGLLVSFILKPIMLEANRI